MATRQYPHPVPGNGISDSIAGLAEDTARLVQLEIALFKQEMLELLMSNAWGIGLLAGAVLSLLFLFIAVQVLIVEAIPNHVLAAVGLAVFWLVLGTVLALVGRAQIKNPVPSATIQTLKEDLEWVKEQIKPATR
jgi:uncharacterized membrane protein YqjE